MKDIAVSLYRYFDTLFLVYWSALTFKITTLIADSGFESIIKDTQNIGTIITIIIGVFWGVFRLYRDFENHQINKKIKAEELRKIHLENEIAEIKQKAEMYKSHFLREGIEDIEETEFNNSSDRIK